MPDLSLSDVVIPWRARRNPFYRVYVARSLDRVAAIGLIGDDPDEPARRRFEAFLQLDGWSFPGASFENLTTAGAFTQWLFFLGERYGHGTTLDLRAAERIMSDALAALLGAAHDGAAFHRFSRWVGERLLRAGAGPWFERLCRHIQDDLVHGSLRAMQLRRSRTLPSLPEYLAIVQHDASLHAILDVLEVARGSLLSEEDWRAATLEEMRGIAAEHVALFKDLVAYDRRGCAFNALHIWARSEEVDIHEVARRLARRLNDGCRRFDELAAALPKGGAHEAVADGIRDWIAGNVAFSVLSTGPLAQLAQ